MTEVNIYIYIYIYIYIISKIEGKDHSGNPLSVEGQPLLQTSSGCSFKAHHTGLGPCFGSTTMSFWISHFTSLSLCFLVPLMGRCHLKSVGRKVPDVELFFLSLLASPHLSHSLSTLPSPCSYCASCISKESRNSMLLFSGPRPSISLPPPPFFLSVTHTRMCTHTPGL